MQFLNGAPVTEYSSSEVQCNTGVLARAFMRTTCRHVGAGVDTARYLFAERTEKRRAARERWKDVVKESAESSRCWPPPPFLQPPLFSRFYLFTRFSFFLPVPFIGPSYVSPFLQRLNVSPRRKRRLSRRLSPWRRVHTSRIKYTESDFQPDAEPGSARYPFRFFFF